MENFINNLYAPFQIVTYLLILILGAFALIKCCDIFLDNAGVVAKKFKIPKIIIGLTIVAIGTSIPELSVSLSDAFASAKEGSSSNIGFSNVVGSNISNLLLVLSFGCLFSPIITKKQNKKDYGIMFFVTLVLTIFVLFFGNDKEILRWEAIILSSFIILYVMYVVFSVKGDIKREDEINKEKIKLFKPILFILICIVGIAIGGELVVYGAKGISMNVSSLLGIEKNMAESFIGLTVVGVGTSLPELVTTIMSSKKGENEIALGNVIGSNIFNIIFVIGLSATIAPFTISSYMIIDLFILIFVSAIVMFFVYRGKLNKKHSYLFLLLYLMYLVYLIIRL